jgi:cardiolipin synthase A/B
MLVNGLMWHNYLGALIFVFDFLVRGYFCVRIIQRRLQVGVSWAWISIILFLPVVGTLLYLYLGEYRQGRRRVKRLLAADVAIRGLMGQAPPIGDQELPDSTRSLARGLRSLFHSRLLDSNDIELLRNADAAFPRIIADIDGAKISCDMEFYIWSDGGRADEFGEALIRAAKRGVKCRVLVDQVGSADFVRGSMAKKLKSAGVQFHSALPSGLIRSLLARPDLRLHRKILVIDRTLAFTGSLNLADPLFFKTDAGVGHWVDALCRVRGPAVQSLNQVFLSDWCAETGEDFLLDENQSRYHNSAVGRETKIQCLPSGPAVKSSIIEEALIMAIYEARKELIMTTPYFVPNEALLFALMAAARREVAVTLIVPKLVDSKLVQYASSAFLRDLVDAGVRVALFRDGLLHTKSITVDGDFSIFGSLNLDQRSLRINFEISLAIYDKGFTQELRALQQDYLACSDSMDSSGAGTQPTWKRFREDLARLAGPLL